VLVVTEQHRIDFADCLHIERRARKLFELHVRQLIGPRRVEGRIRQQAKAIDLD